MLLAFEPEVLEYRRLGFAFLFGLQLDSQLLRQLGQSPDGWKRGRDQRGRRTFARLAGIRADHDSRERSGHIHRDQGDGFADAI